MSRFERIWVVAALVLLPETALASGLGPWVQPNSTAGADCRDFKRLPDGRWKVLRSTKVSVGPYVYSGVEGYLDPRLTQSDGTSIYDAVTQACSPARQASR